MSIFQTSFGFIFSILPYLLRCSANPFDDCRTMAERLGISVNILKAT
jgi:hypothetical protein